MKKILKWVFTIMTIGLILWVGLIPFLNFVFGFNGKDYSKEDLINNYKNKQTSIYKLRNYYNKLVPANKIVEIEFSSNKEISRLAITTMTSNTSSTSSKNYFCDWNLDISSFKVDSVLGTLNWTHKTLLEIKSYLDSANCIGVSNGDPININFQRSGMGMYSYDIFSKPLSDSLKPQYNDSCMFILYNDSVVLEYGGGAIGSQCFEK